MLRGPRSSDVARPARARRFLRAAVREVKPIFVATQRESLRLGAYYIAMPYERAHRLDDPKLQVFWDKLQSAESEWTVPGKQTHAELLVWMSGRLLGQSSAPGRAAGPGKRPMHGAPLLGFHDFQALGLRDVLSSLGPRRALRAAALAAADPNVARRVGGEHGAPLSDDRSSTSPHGQGLWQAAQRRAVTLYRRAFAAGMVALETRAVTDALASIGAGAPLEAAVCAKMEGILGVRLDRVRIHTGAVACAAAHAVNAEAFTVGEDIFLPSYDPTSAACLKLLLHELVHCCQWWQGRIPTTGSGIGVSQPSDALEHEAEAVVARAPIGSTWHEPRRRPRPSAADGGASDRQVAVGSRPFATVLGEPGAFGVDGSFPLCSLVASVASDAAGPASPPQMAMTAPRVAMRKAKSDEQVARSDLPGREWMTKWIEPFLKGEYGFQVFFQDLFRSSLWVPQEQIEEVAEEYASFINDNRGLILASLAAFLALGAGAAASGPPGGVCLALLLAFGVAGIVVMTEEMVEHAAQWLALVRRANGRPEGIAAASREFIHMMVSFALAVEAAVAWLDVSKLPPSFTRWLRARFGASKQRSELSESEQENLLRDRPLSGMSQSGDLKTGGRPGVGGDKDSLSAEAPRSQVAEESALENPAAKKMPKGGTKAAASSPDKKALTTRIKQPITIAPYGEVWIFATPIQRELIMELVRRGRWKIESIKKYIAQKWGNLVGVDEQVRKMQSAVAYAKRGPSESDPRIDIGEIQQNAGGLELTTGLVRVKIGQNEYWLAASVDLKKAALDELSPGKVVRLTETQVKGVKKALASARPTNDLNTRPQAVAELVPSRTAGHYVLQLVKPEQEPQRGQRLIDLLR